MRRLVTILGVSVFASLHCFSEEHDDRWRAFDVNNDNALSGEEFGNYLADQYSTLDKNLDGEWTKREFVNRPAYMKRNDPTRLREKFKRWDKDENGIWTHTEVESAILGNFDWLDKDKNKSISIEEMPTDF